MKVTLSLQGQRTTLAKSGGRKIGRALIELNIKNRLSDNERDKQ
jgi:hypothetical protein